jgi:hypothetical protein
MGCILRFCLQTKTKSKNKTKEVKMGYFPSTSRQELSQACTLISALYYPEERIQPHVSNF